jgi:hypothetical protein
MDLQLGWLDEFHNVGLDGFAFHNFGWMKFITSGPMDLQLGWMRLANLVG